MIDLADYLAQARRRLESVPVERLGELRMPGTLRRAVGGAPRIVPVGSAWRLGVLLLGADDLYATGDVERAAEDVRRGYAARSQRERALVRAAAFRGGFAEGEVFHLDWSRLDVVDIGAGASSGPLLWQGGELMVRWSPAGWLMPLHRYLDEQIDLHASPPAGSVDRD